MEGIDKECKVGDQAEFIHICFPYSDTFVEDVKEYKKLYLSSDGICIIHSTVPVGVSKLCGAVHSPVRGIHPNLAEGIYTFTKYFGGPNSKEASEVFSALGIDTFAMPNSDNTEALKLWDTTIYAWNIILEKEIFKYCEEHGLDFNLVYDHASRTYNQGYDLLEHPEYKKYVLKHVSGRIGGHCLIPNCQLLKVWVAETILSYDGWNVIK